ncbi:cathepsin L-like proteinase isoform X2 [Diabrotica virgifera virgifera]|uniref:Cathepsin L-like proteinase n=1 Tax=Diabrotica virgifera virgifera TaxID=50390 RepID=A0ABM5L4U0_DIAVI|nr:cathepsin L-like proteinase isoform X2 [Diabrotica virgifera virgifera]
MKVIVVIACLIVTIAAELNGYDHWVSFKAKHSKQYKITEDKLRFQIFQDNLREIEEHNARYAKGEVGWYKGVTPFADWTKEEFKALLTRQAASRPKLNESLGVHVADPNVKLASSVDWRSKGAVLPVRDQASCGSCWAFSTAAALEGQLAIHKNEKIPLSPQNLVDCSTQNDGCDGGDQVLAFKFIKSSGISSEADYPYVGVDQKCHKNVHKTVSTISGYKHLSANENALISALSSIGPISVSVDASVWSLYAGGLFDERDCGTDINHAVLAAGYTDEYILVKNSWGTDWGEEGYIRLARGHNICQINEDNSYPIL